MNISVESFLHILIQPTQRRHSSRKRKRRRAGGGCAMVGGWIPWDWNDTAYVYTYFFLSRFKGRGSGVLDCCIWLVWVRWLKSLGSNSCMYATFLAGLSNIYRHKYMYWLYFAKQNLNIKTHSSSGFAGKVKRGLFFPSRFSVAAALGSPFEACSFKKICPVVHTPLRRLSWPGRHLQEQRRGTTTL
jgi:hypothetical protein